ncbi:MAG: ribosome silencing factor [Parachlamydia sp.]|nr:ribosome silencing factor [Parachlamydia sp.]
MKQPDQAILNTIAQAIFDKKGFNILVLDVRKVSSMADYFIIAEGNVDKHVRAISKGIIDVTDAIKVPVWNVEGDKSADWVVVDYGDIVVHLFIPELRERYALEELWKGAEIVDVAIDIKPTV